jgi:hypothetical protein
MAQGPINPTGRRKWKTQDKIGKKNVVHPYDWLTPTFFLKGWLTPTCTY